MGLRDLQLALLGLTACASPAQEGSPPLNVLLICVDDLRAEALRSDRWRLVHWYEAETGAALGYELYDVAGDPRERTNVAADHPEVVAELAADP